MAPEYLAAEKSQWHGRTGEAPGTLLGHHVACDPSAAHADLRIWGFRSDEGVRRNQGRIGAAAGPSALRRALAGQPWHRSPLQIWDGGDISCPPQGNLDQAGNLLRERLVETVKPGELSVVLGGGHETAWPHFRGLCEIYKSKTIGILNIDAHFDLREPSREGTSSGTPFFQARQHVTNMGQPFVYGVLGIQPLANTSTLYRRAQDWQVDFTEAWPLTQDPAIGAALVAKLLAKCDHLYVTICLDAFHSGIAPGVSAAQPMGLSPYQVFPALEAAATSQKLVAIDVVELAPCYDNSNQTTAKLGAQLLGFMIHRYLSP